MQFDHLSLGAVRESLLRGCNVFVHCEKGISRSVAVCMAYLIIYEGHTFRSSYLAVRRNRPIARPNVGFIQQLLELEARMGAPGGPRGSSRRGPQQPAASAFARGQREAPKQARQREAAAAAQARGPQGGPPDTRSAAGAAPS
ncbi:dual-specificity phosphatase, catalytic domain-containing protein, putative, partial [Eimeria tenella]